MLDNMVFISNIFSQKIGFHTPKYYLRQTFLCGQITTKTTILNLSLTKIKRPETGPNHFYSLSIISIN